MKSKSPVVIGIVAGLLVCGICGFAGVGGVIRLGRFVESLPTPTRTPTLIEGGTYWLRAIEGVGPLPGMYWLDLLSLPEHGGRSTIVAVVSDTSQVRLVKVSGEWCYVEVIDEYFRAPTSENENIEEGWIECDMLLDYRPTPVPGPIMTPQRPE